MSTLAKEYGQLRHDIWRDDDWLNLTVPAQHLYMVLLSDPTLNYCGIAKWHVGRLSQRSAENSPRDTLLAALELMERHFIVVDEDTEEVMIRSYLKHDPILKNPRLSVTMSKEYGVIGSRKIRAALVFELTRLKKAHPDWVAWEKPGVMTILRQNAVDAKTMETELPYAASMYLPSVLGSGLPSEMGTAGDAFTEGLQLATCNEQHATGNESKDSRSGDDSSSPQGAPARVKGIHSGAVK